MVEKNKDKKYKKNSTVEISKVTFIVVVIIIIVIILILDVFLFVTRKSEKEIKEKLKTVEKQKAIVEENKIISDMCHRMLLNKNMEALERKHTKENTHSCVGTYKDTYVAAIDYVTGKRIWGTCILVLKEDGTYRKKMYHSNGSLAFDELGTYIIKGNDLTLSTFNCVTSSAEAPIIIQEYDYIMDDCSKIVIDYSGFSNELAGELKRQ